ncbi:protein kinase 4-like [Diorhabda sublineata]|uniref:protein kinase 4-like n=1 Tax=Diorhabda sublineata TaxID=1163346 RepID=UPI0024E18C73|nr:protein kinase 4-like [Diorhabda sublineata]
MLANSYIVHEAVNQNQQFIQEYLYTESFYTQQYTTMNNLEENNYEKENFPIQWHVESENRSVDPEIVKNTNLRIEAKEFVPRYCLDVNTNINYESTKDADQSVVYNRSGGYTLVSTPEEFTKTSWADDTAENVAECLSDLSSKLYNTELSEGVHLIQENESQDKLSTMPTRSFEEFVGQNINISENPEQLHRYCSVDESHLPEFNNTVQTEDCIDRTSQNRDKNDAGNRNFQPRYQYDKNNREHNRNWKKDDGHYRQKGKSRYSQTFRENFSRNKDEEPRDLRRNHHSNSDQQKESPYRYLENDAKPNRQYSDRGKTQDKYHNYDKRRNYNRSSPNFIKNSNEVTEIQCSTTEVNINEETNKNENNEVTVEAETPTQKMTEFNKSNHSIKKGNQYRHNRKEQDADEESFKRKWSDRQSYGNKEVEESKSISEEKGAKPRNRNYQKGRFMNPRSSSNNSREYRDKKDERQQQQIEPAENTEIVKSEHHKERKSKFRTPDNKTSNTESLDEEKHKERNRRFPDKHKSMKYNSKNQSCSDVEDGIRLNRRSFNRDESERKPAKSFRDALFEKKHDKPRDLKQERGDIKVEITVRYEGFKNRPSAVSNTEHVFDETYAESDPEYKAFLQDLKDNKLVASEKIKEQNQDLFKMSEDYSLAHCVAEDMRMGSGIAVTFRNTFRHVDSLLNVNEKPGGLAVLKHKDRFLYYLITKRRSRDKPSYEDFWCSMKRLRDHIKKHQIVKLAVPTLGCGLDQLNWPTVKQIMGYLFRDIPIEIIVCNFTPNEDAVPTNSIKIHHKNDYLPNAKESIIVYFTSADSYVTEEILELNKRFSFLEDFKRAPKNFGGVIKSKVSNCVLCGCVVRKTIKDCFNYKSFSMALNTINKIILDTGCGTIALQHLKDDKDDLLHQKIITLIINYLENAEVFVYMGQMDESFGET